MTLLMTSCSALKIKGPEITLNSFCSEYKQIIKQKGDAASLKGVNLSVKRAIAANEENYECQCTDGNAPNFCLAK